MTMGMDRKLYESLHDSIQDAQRACEAISRQRDDILADSMDDMAEMLFQMALTVSKTISHIDGYEMIANSRERDRDQKKLGMEEMDESLVSVWLELRKELLKGERQLIRDLQKMEKNLRILRSG